MTLLQRQITKQGQHHDRQIEVIVQAITRLQNGRADQPLRDIYNPPEAQPKHFVRVPQDGNDFELKSQIINLIPHFHGHESNDPFHHLEELLHMGSTFGPRNLNEGTLVMKMFPFSLKDKATYWLRTIGRPILT